MTKGKLANQTYHLDADTLGVLGIVAMKDLGHARKSVRKSAVAKIVRLLRIGGLFPANASTLAIGLGVDRNGERVLLIEIEADEESITLPGILGQTT